MAIKLLLTFVLTVFISKVFIKYYCKSEKETKAMIAGFFMVLNAVASFFMAYYIIWSY